MTSTTPQSLTFKENLQRVWFILSILIGVGVVDVAQGKILLGCATIIGCGGWLLLIGPGVIVTVEPLQASVVIQRRSFFRPPIVQTIPLDAIIGVALAQEPVSTGGRTFGVLLVLETGQLIALSSTSCNQRSIYEQQARQISALLSSFGRKVPVIERPIYRQVREGSSGTIAWRLEFLTRTGIRISDGQEATRWFSSGVSFGWSLEFLTRIGLRISDGQGATRWFSSGVSLPNEYIVLCQKPVRMPQATGRMAQFARAAYITAYMRPAQLDEQELSGVGYIHVINDPDSLLLDHFFTMSTSQAAAQAWLTPCVVNVLLTWAEQHPMALFQMLRPNEINRLTIVVSPAGIWVATLSQPTDPVKIETLVGLGLALVKAKYE